MSRLQWLVVFLLGALTACVFGCLGLLLFVPSTRPSLGSRTTTAFVEPALTTPTAYIPNPTARPTALDDAPIQFQLRHYNISVSNYGKTLFFLGDAVNQSPVSAYRVQVAISLLDSQGNVLETSSTNLVRRCEVPPNGRFPFLVGVGRESTQYASVKFQFQSSSEQGLFPCYHDLKIEKLTEHLPESKYDNYGFTGQVVNVGDSPTSFVTIIAIAYDEQDNIIDVGTSHPELSEIAPGGDSPFEIKFYDLVSPPLRYEIFAQGYRD